VIPRVFSFFIYAFPALKNLTRKGCFRGKWSIMTLIAMNFGFSGEIIFILLLALILFGPRRLPELARQMGKFMAEFRRASNDFQSQIHDEIRKLELEEADPSKHLEPVVGEVKKLVDDTDDVSITGALNRLTERIKGSVPQDYDA
jgi:Tat protein translocase TatB subunit